MSNQYYNPSKSVLDNHIKSKEYHSLKEKVEKDLIGLEPKLKGIKTR